MVGTPRCGVPARNEVKVGTNGDLRDSNDLFRRLTLRSATGTAQRAIPTSMQKPCSTDICVRNTLKSMKSDMLQNRQPMI